jgi:hypothetical protein
MLSPEVTLLIRKRCRKNRPSSPRKTGSEFQIEIPTDLLDDFGLRPAPSGNKVIHCMRAA